MLKNGHLNKFIFITSSSITKLFHYKENQEINKLIEIITKLNK